MASLRRCREAAVADLARPVRRGLRGVHRRGDAEALYRAILDTTVDAIAVIDQHEIVRAFNRAAERLFGYAAEAVIGRPVGMLLPDPISATENLYLDPHRCSAAGSWDQARGRRVDGSTVGLALSAAGWIDGTRPYLTVTMRVGPMTEAKSPSPPIGGERAGVRWEASMAQRAHLTLPSLCAGPLPLPPMGGEGFN